MIPTREKKASPFLALYISAHGEYSPDMLEFLKICKMWWYFSSSTKKFFHCWCEEYSRTIDLGSDLTLFHASDAEKTQGTITTLHTYTTYG